jgi:fluoroacetyl-CoA thioesterase
MHQGLNVGLSKTEGYTINDKPSIDFMGNDCRVYSTPYLLKDIEIICRDLILVHCESSEN